MFDRYFCPRVVARLRVSRDADWLLSFLEYLDRRGHARLTVQFYLREAELFGLWLRRRRRRLADVTDRDARAFVTRRPSPRWRCNARSSTNALLRHLRDSKRIPPPAAAASPRIEAVVAAFDVHLRDAAGLAEATRLYCRRYTREFLRSVFAAGPIRWDRLRPSQVHRFIAGYGQTGRMAAARVGAGALHNFLRWLEFQGRVGPALARSVPRFPRWRLIGLLAVTGLRISEALHLRRVDADLQRGVPTIRQTKFRKTRLVPLHPTTTAALRSYAEHRDRVTPRNSSDRFFVSQPGLALPYSTVRCVFRKLCDGLRIPYDRRRPRLHDLRHTFACRRVEVWSEAGVDLAHAIAALSVYLGHAKVTDTYWYLTATPDLMARAAAQFEAMAGTPGKGSP